MYVEQLSNGQYKYVERYKDPMTLKWKRVSVTLEKNDRKSRKLAEEMLRDKINTAQALTDYSKLTLSQLIDKYLAYQQENVKKSTYSRNKGVCKRFKEIFGKDILVANISAGYIKDCLTSTKRANSTKNEWLKRIKALLRWGYDNDYIDDVSYLSKLKPYEDNEKKIRIQDKYLETEEITKLLESMKKTKCTTWIDLTDFLILSGMRIGEAIALQKSDVGKEYIYITKTYDFRNDILSDTPKNEPSVRDVFIQEELKEVIKRIRMHNRMRKVSSTYFFCNDDGNHIKYDNYRAFLRRHSQKVLGRKITPHALRHTHASLLFTKGMTLDEVARRLGHADSEVTREVYIHIMKELLQKDNEKLKNMKLM